MAALTLKLLCEGLENRYSFPELTRILQEVPTELEDFYRYILDSIPEHDRSQVFCLLSITNLIDKTMSDRDIDNSFPLFQASFLSEYFMDSRFTMKQAFKRMEYLEIEDRLSDAKAQLTGRCKGLLETRSDDGMAPLIYRDQLCFTHRSIPEFLKDHWISDSAMYLKDVDTLDALIQSNLAVIKSVAFHCNHLCQTEPVTGIDYFIDDIAICLECCLLLLRESPVANRNHYFGCLDQIDSALQYRQIERDPGYLEHRLSHYRPSQYYASDRRPTSLSLLYIACWTHYHEYFL